MWWERGGLLEAEVTKEIRVRLSQVKHYLGKLEDLAAQAPEVQKANLGCQVHWCLFRKTILPPSTMRAFQFCFDLFVFPYRLLLPSGTARRIWRTW